MGSAPSARHTEPRDYSLTWLLWRSRRKVLLGTAYLCLYCGFSSVGQYTEPRDYSLSRLLWNMGKILLGAAYLYAHRTKRLLIVQVALEHGKGAVGNCLPLCLLWVQLCGPVHRTKRLLTIQVALEHGEDAVGNCLSLCTQNQETTHCPGCSGTAWGRCRWEPSGEARNAGTGGQC